MTETTAPTQMPQNAMPESKELRSKSMPAEMEPTCFKANPEDAAAPTSPSKTEEARPADVATAVSDEEALTTKV